MVRGLSWLARGLTPDSAPQPARWLSVGEQDETRRSYRQARGPALLVALAVSAATFVKGSIGFGFPTLGTPLLTLIVDVKPAFPPGCPAGGSRRR
jgi:hypothetical protein